MNLANLPAPFSPSPGMERMPTPHSRVVRFNEKMLQSACRCGPPQEDRGREGSREEEAAGVGARGFIWKKGWSDLSMHCFRLKLMLLKEAGRGTCLGGAWAAAKETRVLGPISLILPSQGRKNFEGI